mgnify:FL=1
MAYKFEIFKVLGWADTHDVSAYASLPPDDRKQIPLFVVQRWLSGCTDSLQILLLNDIANGYVFSLQRHPTLLWRLLVAANTAKRPRRYVWNKLPGTNVVSKRPASEQALMTAYHYNPEQASEALELLSYDAVFELAEQLGMQQDELDKISVEWGVAVKRKRKTARSAPTPTEQQTSPLSIMDAFGM